MGRAGKGRRSDVKKKAKRAMKEANRAKFEALRDSGRNKKDKSDASASRNGVRNVRHRTGDCGNTGCERCSSTARRMAADRTMHREFVRTMHLSKVGLQDRLTAARRGAKRAARAAYYAEVRRRDDVRISGN